MIFGYRILIIGGSRSGKTSELLNLIKIMIIIIVWIKFMSTIYWYIKDLNEGKYQYLIYKHKKIGLKNEDPIAFIEYSNNI